MAECLILSMKEMKKEKKTYLYLEGEERTLLKKKKVTVKQKIRIPIWDGGEGPRSNSQIKLDTESAEDNFFLN